MYGCCCSKCLFTDLVGAAMKKKILDPNLGQSEISTMNITREIPADIHKQLRQTIEAAYGIEDNCLEDLGCVECCPIFAMTQEYLHLQKDLPPQTTTTMATLLLPPNWMKPAVRL